MVNRIGWFIVLDMPGPRNRALRISSMRAPRVVLGSRFTTTVVLENSGPSFVTTWGEVHAAPAALAAALTNVTWSVSNDQAGATGVSYTYSGTAGTPTVVQNVGIGAGTVALAGTTVTYTVTSAVSISAGIPILLSFGALTNTATTGSYTSTVTTTPRHRHLHRSQHRGHQHGQHRLCGQVDRVLDRHLHLHAADGPGPGRPGRPDQGGDPEHPAQLGLGFHPQREGLGHGLRELQHPRGQCRDGFPVAIDYSTPAATYTDTVTYTLRARARRPPTASRGAGRPTDFQPVPESASDMCGIAGTTARGVSADLGAAPLTALRHRGPDAQSTRAWRGEQSSWELAHARLSIVDLSAAGEQPMENEDGSLVMVFNGEIYNSPELRRYCEAKGHRFSSSMDGEVILHLWEMEGAACLARLNGIFAVAIASTNTGEVVVARDPLGVKPLFYSRGPDRSLWFASELAALGAVGAPLGGHDPVALAQFLSFLWVPDPRTPFVGAQTLEPGQALRWAPDGDTLFFYGRPLLPEPNVDQASTKELAHQVEGCFREAAHRQLLADVPIGLMASGGVDSGLLWWATQDSLDRAYTISWSDPGDFEGLDDDRRAVVELEARFGTPVDYLPGESAGDMLPPSGDLFADPAYDLTRLIARTAGEQGYKVLLSGQGADELFAGYRRHTMVPLVSRLRLGRLGPTLERALLRLPSGKLSSEYATRLARACSEPDPFRAYMQLCTYSTAVERAQALDCSEAEVSNDIVWRRHREVFDRLPTGLSFLRKALALDLAVYLPGLGLAYVDRAGMEFGVEIRVPWLDLDFVRWTLTLPDEALVRRGRGKWLTRDLAAQMLSSDIAQRPKRGFAAPAGRLGNQAGGQGQQGFRQGAYFARAQRILGEYLSDRAGGHPGPERAA